MELLVSWKIKWENCNESSKVKILVNNPQNWGLILREKSKPKETIFFFWTIELLYIGAIFLFHYSFTLYNLTCLFTNNLLDLSFS